MKPDPRYIHPGRACGITISHRKDPADYNRAHKSVRYWRGAPWKYRCLFCGEKAKQWARVHEGCGRDPWDYIALCITCHSYYDDFNYNPTRRKR